MPKIEIERDTYSTGGDISFLWDSVGKIAYFGGENEILQYYEMDIAKGILKSGNRVGVKLILSKNIKDISSLTFKIDKEEINADTVATKIDGEVIYFQLFPLVESAGQTIKVGLEYKGEKDEFYIKIHEKTILMPNFNGEN